MLWFSIAVLALSNILLWINIVILRRIAIGLMKLLQIFALIGGTGEITLEKILHAVREANKT